MRVSEQAAEQVAGFGVAVAVSVSVGVRMSVGVGVGVLGAAVVAAGLVLDLRVRGRRGAIPGAVPLNHEVRDAQHG